MQSPNSLGSSVLSATLRGGSSSSHLGLLGAGDDLVLQGVGQVAEVVAVARHADDEAAVRFRVGLRRLERLAGDDVELDVVAVGAEVGPDELREARALRLLDAT